MPNPLLPNYSSNLNFPGIFYGGVWSIKPKPGKWNPTSLLADVVSYWLNLNENQKIEFSTIEICLEDFDRVEKHLRALSTLISAMLPINRPKIFILNKNKKIELINLYHLEAGVTSKINKWIEKIIRNQNHSIPASLIQDEPSFVWYHPVNTRNWSGRVEGLQVISSEQNTLNVGNPGRDGAQSFARQKFLEIQDRCKDKPENLLLELIHNRKMSLNDSYAIQAPKVRTSLAQCEREHHLESRILRGDIQVNVLVDGNLCVLERATALTFQFPTLWDWRADEKPRYVDALMKQGTTPYILELKINSGGEGEYYRHAVTQALLYREFIRKAHPVHNWFNEQGLIAANCEAAVVLPEGATPGQLEQVRLLANVWGVKLLTVPNR